MKTRSIIIATAALLSGLVQAETVVDISASMVTGTDFTLHYGGGIGTGNNVRFSGTPAVVNGQVNGSTTYGAPDVYVAASKGEYTGNFGVGNGGASGWRIRLNGGVTDGGAFFSDNLFAVDNISFDAANDTLSIGDLFVSDMAAVSNGTVRFVVRDGGSFYISESLGEIQSGALDGNFSTNFSIEALSADWFEYNPTVNPSVNGIADIGAAAAPAFDSIDFVGFHMELTTAEKTAIAGGHNGCNFGVRTFTAQGVTSGVVNEWTKLEYFDFETDAAGTSFGANWVNAGSLGSVWNNDGPTTIAADGAGCLLVSNHQDAATFKIPKAGTANAIAGSHAYAAPLSNGTYRLELDLNSWILDGTATALKSMTLQLRPNASSGSVAGMNLRLLNATTAQIQLHCNLSAGGDQNGFRNFDFPLTNAAAPSLAIVMDYNTSTVKYYVDGAVTHTFTDFDGAPIASLQFFTAAGWSANHVVSIDSMGLSQYNEAAAPVLAVDFDGTQFAAGSHHEYYDFALDFDTPKEGLPNNSGQPIYAGLELDPVNGKATGDDDGAYTNGAAMSFGNNGATLQWNGPWANPLVEGADLGRYEEDDVATGLFLFKKEDFLNGLDAGTVFMNSTNDTLSATVRLNTKENASNYPLQRLKSGQFRWVVQDAGNFYISAEVINMTSDTGDIELTDEAQDLSWFEYDPLVNVTNITIAATPTLQDIDALGFWMSATILTNDGWRLYPQIRCSSFEAEAGAVPVEGPLGQWEEWLGDFTLGTDTNFQDDADGDWVDNLSEYAFGGDPSNPGDQGNTPVQSRVNAGDTNYLEYVYFERDDAAARGLSSSIDVGTDLVHTNWGIHTAEFVGSGASAISGYNAVTNRIPIDAETQKFIRLQIEFTP